MARQTQANARTRKSIANGALACSIWLGPLQRMKLAMRLPFIRKGAFLPVPPKPLWAEKGWQQMADAHQYTGQYNAAGRTWRGMIQQPYAGGYHAYIWQPPLTEIKRHTSHGPCFMANGEPGRYQIHFHSAPTSLDHAITSIERVLMEACQSRA